MADSVPGHVLLELSDRRFSTTVMGWFVTGVSREHMKVFNRAARMSLLIFFFLLQGKAETMWFMHRTGDGQTACAACARQGRNVSVTSPELETFMYDWIEILFPFGLDLNVLRAHSSWSILLKQSR